MAGAATRAALRMQMGARVGLCKEVVRWMGACVRVCREELGRMLRRIGVPLVRAELDAILNKFDLDGNGMIDLSEFVAMILKFWPDATARQFLQIAATLQSIGFETDAGADGCAVELDVTRMDVQTFMNFCQTSGAHFIPSQQRAIGKGERPMRCHVFASFLPSPSSGSSHASPHHRRFVPWHSIHETRHPYCDMRPPRWPVAIVPRKCTARTALRTSTPTKQRLRCAVRAGDGSQTTRW
jgi:hypothetical protein